MPSLALLFAAVDHVSGEAEPGAVEQEQALQAVAWCAYFESHARRLYAAAEDPELERARALLERIRSGDVEDGATARSVYRQQWSRLTTPQEVAGALEVLEAYGWVRVEAPKTGGRPTAWIRLHPALKRRESLVSVSSAALPKLTEALLTPFCRFCQFLTWESARNSRRSPPRLGGAAW